MIEVARPLLLFFLLLLPLVRGLWFRLAAAALILAASGVSLPLRPGLTVVMIDQSPSVDKGALKEALSELKVEGPVRYLAFAADAAWVKNPYARPPLGEGTDLKRAFALAREAGPARILLLSDGLFSPAPPPAPTYAYPLPSAGHAEIRSLVAPPFPLSGERVEVRAVVFSSQETEATLTLHAGEVERIVRRTLPPGTTSVGFFLELKEPIEVVVRLESPLGKDEARARLAPAERPEALVLKDPATSAYLRAFGFSVREADRLPEDLPNLVVVGASAEALGKEGVARLREHLAGGGGLFFTTTPEGLFFGGWHREFADLPLVPWPKDPAAFLLVLDVSGSMAGEKLAQAVKGALFALKFAREGDLFGVLVYSDRPRWLLPLAPLDYRHRRLAEERLKALSAGGGTRLAPALAEARRALEGVRASPKVVIVVTDGQVAEKPAALAEAQGIKKAGARLFVLATGEDAERAFLEKLGEFAETDPKALAGAIEELAKKTLSPSGEEGVFPLELLPHPTTLGLSPPPPAKRLLFAKKKPWARSVMKSGEFDVLALGERGWGRVAALALDLGHDLKDWPDAGLLVANVARWLLDTPARPRYALYQNRLFVMGKFSEPLFLRSEGREIPLAPTGPLRYEAEVPPGRGDLLVYAGSRLLFRVPREASPEWPEVDGKESLKAVAKEVLELPTLGPPPKEVVPLSGALALFAVLFAALGAWARLR